MARRIRLDEEEVPYLHCGAVVSSCENYRYLLERRWTKTGDTCTFLMLNPSTADGKQDDPTIRRCVGFAKSWGFSGMAVVNLFAWRATDPKKMLLRGGDIVGPENDLYTLQAVESARLLVCAWGASAGIVGLGRGHEVTKMLKTHGHELHALKLTAHGFPCHPLYLPAELKPVKWKGIT